MRLTAVQRVNNIRHFVGVSLALARLSGQSAIGLLIRVSLVRAQLEEPISKPLTAMLAAFSLGAY
jgi:hypothetical protein